MLFSIIIPVYNAEKTLAKCVESVLGQTFGDFQLIIVDDGSEDNSLKTAEEYSLKDSRIKVISTAHRGAGAARNRGLECAEGDYVLFLDADDYWLSDALLAELREQTEKHKTDVFMFSMVKVTESGDILKRYMKPAFCSSGEVLALSDIYSDLVRDGQVLASACNKCVRTELMRVNSITFREDIYGEDIDWVLQLFLSVKTIYLMNSCAYAYVQHKEISRSRSEKAPDDLVTIVSEWGHKLNKSESAALGITAFEYGICMGSYHLLSDDKKKLLRENVHLLKNGLDRKTKLIFAFYKIFGFGLTCAAIRFYLFLRRIW